MASRRQRRQGAGIALAARTVLVLAFTIAAGAGLAVVAHGGLAAPVSTVVVEPGDTLWSIASARYPSDDVRVRVEDIERANGLQSPVIEVGQTLQLPG